MKNFNLAEIDSEEAILKASKDLNKLNILINKRKEYRNATGEELTMWLIKGSIVLDCFGNFGTFKPIGNKNYPTVLKWTREAIEDGYNGVTTQGGDVNELPNIFSSCPSCNKKFTIEDVYNHNFKLVGDRVVHRGECTQNYYYMDTSLEISKYILLAVKRALGNIENVSIKQRKNEKCDFVKIYFNAYGYKFDVKINSKSIITVVCKNDKDKIKLYEAMFCTCCYESIEQVLKSWKDEYVG